MTFNAWKYRLKSVVEDNEKNKKRPLSPSAINPDQPPIKMKTYSDRNNSIVTIKSEDGNEPEIIEILDEPSKKIIDFSLISSLDANTDFLKYIQEKSQNFADCLDKR